MASERSRAIRNLVFGIIWLALACMNAYAAVSPPSSPVPGAAMCALDMLLSRLDVMSFLCYISKTDMARVRDPRINACSVLAAIGAGIYMVVNAGDLAQGRVSAISAASLLFLVIASYALSLKARRAR